MIVIEGNGYRPSHRGDGIKESETMVIIIEHHPNDSRTKIAEDQRNCQALTSRMGTGGGNVPLILQKETENETEF